MVFNNIMCQVLATGMDNIKILNFVDNHQNFSFYLDLTDRRFWKLHTNMLADDYKKYLNYFVYYSDLELDRIWYPSKMLYSLSGSEANVNGLKIEYDDEFTTDKVNSDLSELKFRVSGRSSLKAVDALRKENDFENSLAYSRLVVKKGQSRKKFIQSDITFKGDFTVKNGHSIEDHFEIIENAKEVYANKVREIEDQSIGISEKNSLQTASGKSFDIEFNRNIEDIEWFLERLLTHKFRIWGLKSKLKEDYYQISGLIYTQEIHLIWKFQKI